jgi:hypothetical protein
MKQSQRAINKVKSAGSGSSAIAGEVLSVLRVEVVEAMEKGEGC